MIALSRAVRLAKKKARHRFHKHAAIVFNKRSIIATGWNTGRWHAEQNAIGSVSRDGCLRGASILVIRIRRDGRLGMSRPCQGCMDLINAMGMKAVYYSDNDGEIMEER